MLDKPLKTKTVCFKVGTVWAGCQEVHSDIVRAVAGNRKIESFSQMGDLHE